MARRTTGSGTPTGEPWVPMSNGTVDWMATQGQPFIKATMSGAVADSINKHITFLDTTHAFSGHEVEQHRYSSRSGGQTLPRRATQSLPRPSGSCPSAATTSRQHRKHQPPAESYHPNRFGQQALGVASIRQSKGGPTGGTQATCAASARGPDQVTVTRR